MNQQGADIYCRVIDNYGDIGVCWRLAQQLKRQLPTVRLWVDDLRSFSYINPQIQANLDIQVSQEVEVRHWTAHSSFTDPLGLLIEAFACELPDVVKQKANEKKVVWLNLEYLSAEDWVPSFHLGPSPQPGGQIKYFFFPGFTAETGGLLREPDLFTARDALQSSPAAKAAFFQTLGVPPELLKSLHERRTVFLFCYPNAPVPALLQALADEDALLLVPASVAQHISWPHNNALATHILPAISQEDFDRVLWCSDLNIVRGEDSLVRALWAGQPMLWQPYAQQEDWHLQKLHAWLQHSGYSKQLQQLHFAWSQGEQQASYEALQTLLSPKKWPQWQSEATDFSQRLRNGPELSQAILSFYTHSARTR